MIRKSILETPAFWDAVRVAVFGKVGAVEICLLKAESAWALGSPLAPMKKLLREPLLHFVLLGALLFAAYHLVYREPKADPQRIPSVRARSSTW